MLRSIHRWNDIPQRFCCGPIEATYKSTTRIEPRRSIPQRFCCGPIEARHSCYRLAVFDSFRNDFVAAPLKLDKHYGGLEPTAEAFRNDFVAAPLKLVFPHRTGAFGVAHSATILLRPH